VVSLVYVKRADVEGDDGGEGVYTLGAEDWSGGWNLPSPFCEEASITYLPSLRVQELPFDARQPQRPPLRIAAFLKVFGYEGSEVLLANKEAADFLRLLRFRLDGIPLR
jgi:hypothetical protein